MTNKVSMLTFKLKSTTPKAKALWNNHPQRIEKTSLVLLFGAICCGESRHGHAWTDAVTLASLVVSVHLQDEIFFTGSVTVSDFEHWRFWKWSVLYMCKETMCKEGENCSVAHAQVWTLQDGRLLGPLSSFSLCSFQWNHFCSFEVLGFSTLFIVHVCAWGELVLWTPMAAEGSKGWTKSLGLPYSQSRLTSQMLVFWNRKLGCPFSFSLLSYRSPVGINIVFVLELLLLIPALKG